jgi:DNA-binding LacI/PurR family transcriptional regulator
MEPFLPRPTLVAHVAEMLRRGLAERRWGERLPGERRLSVQLGVSRPTLRKALAELRRAGWVKVEHGRPSRPTGKIARQNTKVMEQRTVLVLAPESLEKLPAAAVFVFDQLRSNLSEAGMRLEVRAVRLPRRAQAAAPLEALLAAERPAAFLLFQAEPAVHRWVRERVLPCVVFGTQDAAFPLPALDLDQRATCRHAAQTFLRSGVARERIALIVPEREAPGHAAMREGFHDALGTAGRVFGFPLEPALLGAALDRLRTQIGSPLALIFDRAGQAAGALGHFGIRRKLRIPAEVALISLSDDPFLRFVQPALARYERDDAELARQLSALVVRVAGGASVPPRMVRLMPEFIRGETV